MTELIGRLAAGPLDVVGDVHGELEALRALVGHLGYRADGSHPQGRRLVFVGDLCDRGPDSPGVVRWVQGLVEAGVAQAVMGNHELNLVRGDWKEGNGWFFHDPEHRDRRKEKFTGSVAATARERESFLRFFETLPLALERDDLRVVHACWHRESIDALSRWRDGTAAAFDHHERSTLELLEAEGTEARARQEEERSEGWLHEPLAAPTMLPNVARRNALKQMGNPLRVLSSGIERETSVPFFSSGEWRFVERVNWWGEYRESVPVIVGHYWRWAAAVDRSAMEKGGPDLFGGVGLADWHGARRNVFCVDFSVGRRFVARARGLPADPACRLGALRWPEGVVVFDDGEVVQTRGLA